MHKLALQIKELSEQLSICKRCGMCHAVCPVFLETAREADVARGKLALLDGLVDEIFENPEGVYERLNRCLLCGSCAADCPRKVNTLEIFLKARIILTDFMGLSLRKKIILRGLLARPESFNRDLRWISAAQKIFNKPVTDNSAISHARRFSPILRNRHFVPLSSVPFHRMQIDLDSIAKGSGIKAAFFTGCLIDKIFPNIAQATISALKYHQVGILIPESQGCCGMPAVSAGDRKTFDQLIRYNIEQFCAHDFDYLLTACATCTFTIKKLWPMLFQGSADIKDKINRIAAKTMDLNQFLVSKAGLEPPINQSNDPVVVTYHDPCHLKKSFEISDEPRKVIKANSNYFLREMQESDQCCGLGGSFNLQYYEISTKIGQKKIANIKASEASVVASGCPACMLQISAMLSQAGSMVLVKHPVEIYAEYIKKEYC